MPVDGIRCGEAKRAKEFIPEEAKYQDEESNKWTTNTDDIKIIQDLYKQWSSKIDKILHVFEENNLKEGTDWLRSFI